jgi:transposase
MTFRRTGTMQIQEVLRLLRDGVSDRETARLLRLNRRTVVRYREWAEAQELLSGELPSAQELEARLAVTLPGVVPPQQTSTVEAYRAEIAAYRGQGVEVAAIRARLEETHQVPVSYSAVWRLVRGLTPAGAPAAFVRVEVAPGSEAQVDFGYAGQQVDPTSGLLRKSWVFVLVLSWSRHLYAELVFDQRVETWLLCHRHAFEFFGGVPERVVLDNLKTAIVRASIHEPLAQRAYRECAGHYGFRIDPNPPYSPHLKGKVEQGGVHYVKRNFLAGREPAPLDQLNRKLRSWCSEIAGQRIHGTTKERPLERFRQVERAKLRALPALPYDLATWKQAVLSRDCHLVFQAAYYSAPYRLVGQTLWIRAGSRTVELFAADHELVATHDRASRPGQRQTILAHLPPEKVPGLVASRETCQTRATAIGPSTSAVVERLLAHRPEDRLRVAQRVLALAGSYTDERLERACARALHFGSADYLTLKRILAGGLDREPLEPPAPPRAQSFTFVRQAGEFMAGLLAAAGAGR